MRVLLKKMGMTADERKDIIVKNLQVVNKRDKMFVLGDVGNNRKPQHLIHWNDVDGVLNLVQGNHDLCHVSEYLNYFDKVFGVVKYKNFTLSHIPLHPTQLRGRVNIHGHMHNGHVMMEHNGKYVKDPRYINVNLDQTGLKPVTWEQIIDMVDFELLQEFEEFKDWCPKSMPKG